VSEYLRLPSTVDTFAVPPPDIKVGVYTPVSAVLVTSNTPVEIYAMTGAGADPKVDVLHAPPTFTEDDATVLHTPPTLTAAEAGVFHTPPTFTPDIRRT